jgi:hypothetical protein
MYKLLLIKLKNIFMNRIKLASLIATLIIIINLTLGLFGVLTWSITAIYAVALCGWASVFVREYSEYFKDEDR